MSTIFPSASLGETYLQRKTLKPRTLSIIWPPGKSSQIIPGLGHKQDKFVLTSSSVFVKLFVPRRIGVGSNRIERSDVRF